MIRPNIIRTFRKKRYSRCRICQKFGLMTKEHVPPKKAFNDKSYLDYYVDQVSKAERVQWLVQEENTSGRYVFTLCEKCNNKTGIAYGNDYINFVKSLSSAAVPENANQVIEVEIKDFFPVRVVKQVISMVLSTSVPSSFNNHEFVINPLIDPSSVAQLDLTPPDISDLQNIYEELRHFVRKRDAKGLPQSVRLYAFVNINTGIGFQTGIFGTAKISTQKVAFGVVTGLHPVHWVLSLQGEFDEKLLDVTDWAQIGYKNKKSKIIQIPCYWTAGKYPLDFRTAQQIKEVKFVARMSEAGFSFKSDISERRHLEEAIRFARRHGRWTREGYLMSEFSSGVYFEADGLRDWIDGANLDEARQLVKNVLAQSNK